MAPIATTTESAPCSAPHDPGLQHRPRRQVDQRKFRSLARRDAKASRHCPGSALIVEELELYSDTQIQAWDRDDELTSVERDRILERLRNR